METLKQLEEITASDERNLYFLVTETGGHARRLTLEDIYEHVSSIKLNPEVPDSIKSHFAQAQNLAVYSWYYYPFNVTSQFMGFVSVEYALQIKSGKDSSFKHLIQLAVKEGWIHDNGFSIAKLREDNGRSYVETLIEVMPSLRNTLAHGSDMLHNNALASLRICAEFINQLFMNND